MKILLNKVAQKTKIILADGTDITEELMLTGVNINAEAGSELTVVTLTLMIDEGSIKLWEPK